MQDPTEKIRMAMVNAINSKPIERIALEKKHGQVWNTEELKKDFSVLGFMAPFIVVQRKSDGVKGSLMFQHDPRYYFSFTTD